MVNFDTEDIIVEITNKAIRFRNENDIANFNNTILEIDELYYHRKFELLEFLFPNNSDDTMHWTDKFILNDINLSFEVIKSLDLFLCLVVLGKNYEKIFYQNIIASILKKINLETDEIYYAREFILNHTEFELIDCIPTFFKLKENEILPKLPKLQMGEPAYQFILNKNGKISLELHSMFESIDEAEIELGIEFENERIENTLKLIPLGDSLKQEYENSKNIFFH
jgi:hypothetical protein